MIRHFDFQINPSDRCLEEEDFSYESDQDESTQSAKSKISDKTRDDFIPMSMSRGVNNKRPRLKDIPQSLFFDGEGDFHRFESKFLAFVKMEEYDSTARFFCLRMMLQGSASEYIDILDEKGELATDTDALLLLKKRYGSNLCPHQNIRDFREAVQKSGESYDDFETRLFRLANVAYPRGSYQQIETEVAMSFMSRIRDPVVKEYLADWVDEPKMEVVREALARYNFKKELRNRAKKDMFHVSHIEEDNEDFVENELDLNSDERLVRVENDVKDLKETIGNMSQTVVNLTQEMAKLSATVNEHLGSPHAQSESAERVVSFGPNESGNYPNAGESYRAV